MCQRYMCILLYVQLIQCSGVPYIYGQLKEGGLDICAFCYMWNLFGVVVCYRSMVDWRGYMCPRYMCILLYVKLIWWSGIPYIYGQLKEGGLDICAFCYMWNWFGLVVFHTSLMDWRGVRSSDGYRSLEKNVRMSRWPYVVLLLATRCLYVKLMQCSGIPEIYGDIGGISALVGCAFCYLWNVFGVVVLHTSMINWRGQLIWLVQVIWKCKNVKMTLCSTPLGHQMSLC